MEGREAQEDKMPEIELAVESLFGEQRVNHGSPTQTYDYCLPTEVEEDMTKQKLIHQQIIKLSLPDSTSYLMAQFVWQSSITLSHFLLQASNQQLVRGKDVIELGAGSGLPSLVSALLQPKSVLCTDYPEPAILENIRTNIRQNLQPDFRTVISVEGLKWGPNCRASTEQFDVVLMADTLWLEHEHDHLIASLTKLVKSKEKGGLVISAFMHHDEDHRIATDFFQKCTAHGFIITEKRDIEWDTRKLNGVYEVTEVGEYGPVYLHKMVLPQAAQDVHLKQAS